MVDKEVKADLASLIEILSSFDFKDSIQRKRQVEQIIEFCRECKRKDIIKDAYSIRFLSEGVGAYLLGLDEAAMYYSGLSVELILLSRLIKKYGQFCSDKMHSFKLLIKYCKIEGILDEERRQVADNLRWLRNCYVHYDNLLNYSSIMRRKLIESFNFKDNKLIETLESAFSTLEAAYPSSKANILRRKRTSFLSKRAEEYNKWLQSQGLALIDVLKIGFTKEEDIKYRRVRQQKFDALTALQWTFQLLQFLSP